MVVGHALLSMSIISGQLFLAARGARFAMLPVPGAENVRKTWGSMRSPPRKQPPQLADLQIAIVLVRGARRLDRHAERTPGAIVSGVDGFQMFE